jgi:hypothetical protein
MNHEIEIKHLEASDLPKEKTKVLGFVGTDHLRTKIVINDEIL